ncbi:MAG: hypothetical protein AVDCRST_MAG19-1003, partial [uncultured Thermomicrobiales bacterium]
WPPVRSRRSATTRVSDSSPPTGRAVATTSSSTARLSPTTASTCCAKGSASASTRSRILAIRPAVGRSGSPRPTTTC